MIIGNRHFDTANKTYIMGILNVTPDSFSDGGKYNNPDGALFHVQQMISEGASIIDVGGESTRPGYTRISDEEEINRTVPVIEAIKKKFDIPVSIDTYKSRVAGAAIEAGADLVNDIWGLKADDNMAKVCEQTGCCICLMHNRKDKDYRDFETDWINDIKQSFQIAKDHHIGKDKIILDPGVGFAKTTEQNLYAINHLDDIRALGYPVLLGTSNKSVIGNVLNLSVDDRLYGTLATTAVGIFRGASFIRVHDILANKRVIDMTEAIIGAK